MDMTEFTTEPLHSHFHHIRCLGEIWFALGAFSNLPVSRTAETKDPKVLAERLFKILHRLDGQFESRDPKDRLFAILSMVSMSQDAFSDAGLNIDYGRAAEQIFHDLAVFLLQNTKSLNLLSHCGPVTSRLLESESKPSWVPTWGPSHSDTLRKIASSERSQSDTVFRFSKDKKVLYLKGAAFDHIAFVADEISFNLETQITGSTATNEAAILRAKLITLEEQILSNKMVQKRYGNTFLARDALKHTLLHPRDKDQMLAEHAYYDSLMEAMDEASPITSEELLRRVSTMGGSRSSRFKPHELMYKRPFVTSKGYIGLAEGRAQLQIGDNICVFRGGTVPFILWKASGSYYSLISTCYVYDIMSPEAQYKLVRRWKCAEFAIK
jgi:hypothetical protein